MKTIYRVLLTLTILAIIGFGGAAYYIEGFQYENILKLFVDLAQFPIDFVVSTLDTQDFTSPDVLAIGGGVLVLFLVSLFVFIKQLTQKRLLGAIFGFVFINLLSYSAVALTLPVYPSPLGANPSPYLYYVGELVSQSPLDLEALVLYVGLPTALVDFLLLTSLHSIFAKPRSKKVKVVKVKPIKVVDKKVKVQPLKTTQEAVQVKPTATVQPLPTQDANLSELVRLVMAEEIQNMKQSGQGYSGQADAALIRRIVAEELSRFQVHFISRAEVQTILAQEIALLKLSLNIK